MDPQPSTSTTTDYKSGPISLEMFNHAAADLNNKGVINMKKYKNIFTSLHPKNMNPHELVSLVGPANNLAMGSIPMHLARILLQDGHTLPPHLFMDVLTEKTQTLLEFIRLRHVGLCMTANIRAQSATLQVYDTFTATITQLFQVTITNTLDLENQLFHLYMEIHALVDSYLPDEGQHASIRGYNGYNWIPTHMTIIIYFYWLL